MQGAAAGTKRKRAAAAPAAPTLLGLKRSELVRKIQNKRKQKFDVKPVYYDKKKQVRKLVWGVQKNKSLKFIFQANKEQVELFKMDHPEWYKEKIDEGNKMEKYNSLPFRHFGSDSPFKNTEEATRIVLLWMQQGMYTKRSPTGLEAVPMEHGTFTKKKNGKIETGLYHPAALLLEAAKRLKTQGKTSSSSSQSGSNTSTSGDRVRL